MENKRKKIFVISPKKKSFPFNKYRSGSDVQSLWKKYGWTPPSKTNKKITKNIIFNQKKLLLIKSNS